MDLPPPNTQQRTNPIQKNRRPTDRYFIFVFLAIVMTWFAIGILGFFSRQRTDDGDDLRQFRKEAWRKRYLFNALFMRFSHELIISLITSFGITLLFTMLIGSFTKIFAWTSLAVDMFYIFGNEFLRIYGIIKNYENITTFEIINVANGMLGKIFFLFAYVLCLYKIGINASSNIIRTSIQILLGRPSLILFSGFLVSIAYSVVLFTINAGLAHLLSDQSIYLIVFFETINLATASFLLLSIWNFALMVISEYTINYYWKNGENPRIVQSILRVLRYHIGTIMFSSTVPVSLICAIIQLIKHKRSQENKENELVYSTSTIFLTISMPIDTALVFSSVYGTNFNTSSKKAFDTVLRHCLLFLVTTWVVKALFLFMKLVAEYLADVMAFIFVGELIDNDDELLTYILVYYYGFLYLPVSFGIVMYISIRSMLFNQIIALDKED